MKKRLEKGLSVVEVVMVMVMVGWFGGVGVFYVVIL